MAKQTLNIIDKISVSMHIPVGLRKAKRASISVAHYIDQPYKICINKPS